MGIPVLLHQENGAGAGFSRETATLVRRLATKNGGNNLKAKSSIIILCVLFVIFVHSLSSFSENRPTKLPAGAQPYTPSRLEWLALELNAEQRIELSEESGFAMTFVPVENENAILIFVRYLENVNREIMNTNIDTARKVISMKAKSHGWDSWLKVKEDVQMSKPRVGDVTHKPGTTK